MVVQVNIKEHIEAGHYPKDEKGRALVPTPEGKAVIAATDAPGMWILMGWRDTPGGQCQASWHADGAPGSDKCNGQSLLPPPPRKVKVTAYAVMDRSGRVNLLYRDEAAAKRSAAEVETVVPLTGEYEEPWP